MKTISPEMENSENKQRRRVSSVWASYEDHPVLQALRDLFGTLDTALCGQSLIGVSLFLPVSYVFRDNCCYFSLK